MHLPSKVTIYVNSLDVYSQKQKSYEDNISCKVIKQRRQFLSGDAKYRKYDLILVVDEKELNNILSSSTVDFTIHYGGLNYEPVIIDQIWDYSGNSKYYEISCVEIK